MIHTDALNTYIKLCVGGFAPTRGDCDDIIALNVCVCTCVCVCVPTGAFAYNRPCAQQDVGKYQS
eukprot:COSAG05_NODE_8289_length_718_cov_0.762520_1_plen_64_part_10